jgi:hypothetical protein
LPKTDKCRPVILMSVCNDDDDDDDINNNYNNNNLGYK